MSSLGKLRGLRHLIPEHELGSLQRNIISLMQEFKTVVDNGPERLVHNQRSGPGNGVVLVEEDAPSTQEVPTVADNLHSPLRVVAIQPFENLVIYSSGKLNAMQVL